METSGSTNDKETGFLTIQNSACPARDAATQTPQMIRHLTPTRRHQARASTKGSSSSEESLVYEDSIAHPPSIKDVGTPIPAVVIEYSKDTLALTKEMDFNSVEQPTGIPNLAFESNGETVRYVPASEFLQQTDRYHPNGPVFLQPNQHLLFTTNPPDPLGPSTMGANPRLYYSLPRASVKKPEKDLMIRSQPPTPQMNRLKDTGVDTNSSFWIIPRDESKNSMNTIETSATKYATPGSVNGPYTISGRSAVVTNGFPEPVIGLYEMHLVPAVETPAQSTPKSLRKFEFTKMPASVDLQRRRLQFCTDGLSLLLLLPGLLIAAGTPALTVPMFFVPPTDFPLYIVIFLASGTLSAFVLCLSGIVGNLVWYYDENTKKLKLRMHCGRGPTFHFWGNALYDIKNLRKPKELIV